MEMQLTQWVVRMVCGVRIVTTLLRESKSLSVNLFIPNMGKRKTSVEKKYSQYMNILEEIFGWKLTGRGIS